MSSQRIEKTLEKYFQGETSLAEEQKLRDFFLKEEVPAHMAELKEQFQLYQEESQAGLPDDFEDTLFAEIDLQEKSTKASKRSMIFYISGVAATILILITLFIQFDPFIMNSSDKNLEAELAFGEASRVLFFVSEQLNKGTDPLANVARFDEGIDNLNTVTKLDEGMTKATPMSRFNQITNLLTNPAP